MKKVNITDIRNKTEIEIKEMIKSMRKDVEAHVSEVLKGKEKNPKKAIALRRELARLHTLLNEKKFLKETKVN